MSEPNVELARRLTELLMADDPQGAAEYFSPDAELRMRLGTYSGHEGVAQWARDVREFLGDYEFTQSEYIDGGGVVVHLARVRATGQTGGLEVEQDFGFVMWFEEGKVTSAASYPNRAEALEAAGLPEASRGRIPG